MAWPSIIYLRRTYIVFERLAFWDKLFHNMAPLYLKLFFKQSLLGLRSDEFELLFLKLLMFWRTLLLEKDSLRFEAAWLFNILYMNTDLL